ncbi:hypothetical protein L1987_04853 [Smallanthus sonchifolius]|uniref:Uncharacterized protein n=1 Tax=Smallanthus sonchifolius TaxID=185202 RepID=A0ACB9JTT1_9ASTR|nr:hypothetical protein L1987_04853 [Smallanthus sonchifolius]
MKILCNYRSYATFLFDYSCYNENRIRLIWFITSVVVPPGVVQLIKPSQDEANLAVPYKLALKEYHHQKKVATTSDGGDLWEAKGVRKRAWYGTGGRR